MIYIARLDVALRARFAMRGVNSHGRSNRHKTIQMADPGTVTEAGRVTKAGVLRGVTARSV